MEGAGGDSNRFGSGNGGAADDRWNRNGDLFSFPDHRAGFLWGKAGIRRCWDAWDVQKGKRAKREVRVGVHPPYKCVCVCVLRDVLVFDGWRGGVAFFFSPF